MNFIACFDLETTNVSTNCFKRKFTRLRISDLIISWVIKWLKGLWKSKGNLIWREGGIDGWMEWFAIIWHTVSNWEIHSTFWNEISLVILTTLAVRSSSILPLVLRPLATCLKNREIQKWNDVKEISVLFQKDIYVYIIMKPWYVQTCVTFSLSKLALDMTQGPKSHTRRVGETVFEISK